MESVLYEELRPSEFLSRLNQAPIAYLPLGTLEWHGPHLPLGSDGLQSRALFCDMARRIGGIVMPMLFVAPDKTMEYEGKTYIGMDFWSRPAREAPRQLPGSAYYVSDSLYDALLDAVMAQLARAGFRIVVGHGHGPANQAFQRQIPFAREKYGLMLVRAVFEQAQYGYQSDHAAANETSIMMHYYPQLVNMSALPQETDARLEGVNGDDPRKYASAEMGRAAAEETMAFLEAALTKCLGELRREGHRDK